MDPSGRRFVGRSSWKLESREVTPGLGITLLAGDVIAIEQERIGYQVDRQRGSHIVMRHPDPPFRRITVPDHHEVAKGTLRAILRQAGISSHEMVALLD